MGQLALGIDFGTSGVRAIARSRSGQIQAQAELRFAHSDHSNWLAIWKSALSQLVAAIPSDVRQQIQAIAINGTSSTVVLCDRTGQPLTSPLFYNDVCPETVLEQVRQIAPPDHPVISATSSLAKLLWWQQQPFFPQAHYFLHQADWLAFLLHGQLGISDYHNCLKLGYDVAHLDYPDWLQALPLVSLLPQVRVPGTAIAPIQTDWCDRYGLALDCQIRAGTTDSIAAFLASGASEPGEAVTSLGSTLVLKLLSETPVNNSRHGIYSHRLGDLWLVGGASNTGGAVLQQFFTPDELRQLSAQIPVDRESPLDYYPLVKPGERFPIADPTLPPRLEPHPDDAVAFLHGLLESIARIEARGYWLLQELGATPLTRVYTAGGGAANSAWTKIRDRHLPVPLAQPVHTEAAYGTAKLAMGDGKLNCQ